jgi:excisionase family DNA binding protein
MGEPVAAYSGSALPVNDDDSAGDWLSVRQAAAIPRCSERRIHDAVRAGELRAAAIDGRGTLRIHRRWLRAWLEKLADRGVDRKSAAAGERNDVAEAND